MRLADGKLAFPLVEADPVDAALIYQPNDETVLHVISPNSSWTG